MDTNKMNIIQKILLKRFKTNSGRIVYCNRHIITLSPKWAIRAKWVLKHILKQKVLFRGRGNRKSYVGKINQYGYKYSLANLQQSLPLRFAEKYAIYIIAK